MSEVIHSVQTHLRIRSDLWKQLRVQAILAERSDSAMVEEAIELLLDSKGNLPLNGSKQPESGKKGR